MKSTIKSACGIAFLMFVAAPFAAAQSATTQPAMAQPAMGQPGMTQPGMSQPGMSQSSMSQSPTTRPADMPADQLLQQMLRPPAGPAVQPLQPILNPPAMDQTSGKMVVPGAAIAQSLKREGDYVRDRLGRLNKGADGTQMEFTFESDGRAMQDPPVIILPNLKLMAMENAVNGSNRDLRFRITGPVTEYKGRNYILLEKVSVVQDATQQF